MSPARLRVSCLLLVTLATLIHLVGGSVAWQAAGIVVLLLYLMTLKGQLTRMAKGLLCAAGVLTLPSIFKVHTRCAPPSPPSCPTRVIRSLLLARGDVRGGNAHTDQRAGK